jgi:hypothetical protein
MPAKPAPKTRYFIFDVIKQSNVDDLTAITTTDLLKQRLRGLFAGYLTSLSQDKDLYGGNRTRLGSMESIFINFMCEYTQHILGHVKEDKKISVLIQVGYELFKASFSQQLTKNQSIELMSDMLNRHTIDSPPFRIKILDLEDVKMASQHFVWNFYSWYTHYYHVMAKKRLIVIASSTVKFGNMPMSLACSEGALTDQPLPIIANMYLKTEDEFVITKEEMELIMRGESSLNLPPKKRQELIRAKLEAEKKERIEKVMARELGILNIEIEEKLREIREENEALLA